MNGSSSSAPNPTPEDHPGQDLEALKEQRLKEILDPAKCGLLVVDLQNDFLSPDGKSAKWGHDVVAMQRVLPGVATMVKAFHEQGRPVIWTKTFEDAEFRTAAGRDRLLWLEGNDPEEVACLKGTPGAELYVTPDEGDIVIEKTTGSAYIGTPLKDLLGEHGIETLMIVGIKTQRCVQRTVHDLAENEPALHVVVLEDCCASDNPAQHESTLAEMKAFYPPVLSSQTVLSAWQTSPPPTP